jgi:hypothetical protein
MRHLNKVIPIHGVVMQTKKRMRASGGSTANRVVDTRARTMIVTNMIPSAPTLNCIGLILAVLFATFSYVAPALAGDKILLGPHIGSATIVSISGVNSDRAAVSFRREIDDLVETCARETGNRDDDDYPSKVAECVKAEVRQARSHIYTRRALCSRHTIYTEFGNFSLVKWEKEEEFVSQGKRYRPIRTDWKDHKTETIVGNCSACNTPQMIDTFKVLCPTWYDKLFDGYSPY